MARLKKDFDITVDWKGFELHPETPMGGISLSRLFPAARSREMREHMKNFAAGFGIKGMNSPEMLPNTRRVLAIAEYARDMGKLDIFRSLAMQAHWKESRNLEDTGVLSDLASASGLDPQKAILAGGSSDYFARVDATRAEADRLGITGIPTFIIDRVLMVGCQSYQILADAVLQAGGSRRK